MVFGMLPMSIGAGAGGELLAPMGRAVIGGVMTSTLLTLLVVPVLYTYIYGFTQRIKAGRQRKREAASRSAPADVGVPSRVVEPTAMARAATTVDPTLP
jgi:hypothetical protein